MISLEQLMTTEPYYLAPDNTAFDARRLMLDKHIRHIPILDPNNNLVGLVTERDLLAVAGSWHDDEEHRQKESSIPIGTFMTTKLHTVDPQVSLRGAALYLQKHRHGCLPVVEDSKLVGIITDSDFVGIAINLLEQAEQTEPDEEDF